MKDSSQEVNFPRMILLGLYRNNKKGTLYRVTGIAKDCTNARNGSIMVIYEDALMPSKIYVRDLEEFSDKFTLTKSIVATKK